MLASQVSSKSQEKQLRIAAKVGGPQLESCFFIFFLFVDGKVVFDFLSFKVGRLLAREGGNCEEVVSSPENFFTSCTCLS